MASQRSSGLAIARAQSREGDDGARASQCSNSMRRAIHVEPRSPTRPKWTLSIGKFSPAPVTATGTPDGISLIWGARCPLADRKRIGSLECSPLSVSFVGNSGLRTTSFLDREGRALERYAIIHQNLRDRPREPPKLGRRKRTGPPIASVTCGSSMIGNRKSKS